MKAAAGGTSRFARRAQRGVAEEAAVLDRLVDADEILLHDSAGAEVEVADLRVAHLALRQADCGTGRIELGVRIGRPQVVEDRRIRQ